MVDGQRAIKRLDDLLDPQEAPTVGCGLTDPS
jgi:hypothetical protein